MNSDPNFPNQDSAAPQLSTAERQPGVEAMDDLTTPSSRVSTGSQPEAAQNPASDVSGKLSLPPIRQDLSFEECGEEAMRLAQEAFSQTGSWVIFYREVLGEYGVVRKLFKATPKDWPNDRAAKTAAIEALRRFEQSPQFGDLLEMAAALRSQDTGKGDEFEPQKMITVRLPRSQHETLKLEATEHETSINKLCISKLLLPITSRFVPVEKGKVRGRKPGPQGSRNQRLTENETTPS